MTTRQRLIDADRTARAHTKTETVDAHVAAASGRVSRTCGALMASCDQATECAKRIVLLYGLTVRGGVLVLLNLWCL